jgi:plastocyanin
MRSLRSALVAVALCSLILLAGCSAAPSSSSGGSGPAPSAVTVSLKSMASSPVDVTVAVGGTVTFDNDDTVQHNIAGDAFSTGPMAPGAQFFQVFKTTGTFPMHCTIHPNMTGTITVK